LCGPFSGASLLQTIHQSLIFRDQCRASVSFEPLDFEKPSHQLAEVSHDFLQGWFTDTIGDCPAEKLFKSDQF
jgi:hypothetical protein